MASGPKAGEKIPFESYSVCLGGNIPNQCCIIWGNRLLNAYHRDLVNAAKKISAGCVSTAPLPVIGIKPRVNGRTTGTLIGGTCTEECLPIIPEDDCSRSSPI